MEIIRTLLENVGKYTKNTTKDPNSIRPWMKFNYSLDRKHDGRSLNLLLSLWDRLKASWEISWPERKKQFGFMAHFQLRLNPCNNQMKRFKRFDDSINQISLQIWLRKRRIRTVFVELRCIYKHSLTYFQPFSQRYIDGFSKNDSIVIHLGCHMQTFVSEGL